MCGEKREESGNEAVVFTRLCFRLHQDSRNDESLSRVQLDLALKSLYISGGVPHSGEGDQERGGAEVVVMDTMEHSEHAQVSLESVSLYIIVLSICCFYS